MYQNLKEFFASDNNIYIVARICLALVFLLFGIGKFNAEDATELAGVVAAHPILGLGPRLLGDLGFSVMLGCIELICATLLLVGLKNPEIGFAGGMLAVCTFVVTSSLVLFANVWRESAGAPFGNFTGLFLFKDFGLLAASIMIAAHDAKRTIGRPTPSKRLPTC